MQSKFKDIEAAHRLLVALQVAMSAAQELSNKEAHLKTLFEVHKSINILYKGYRSVLVGKEVIDVKEDIGL